MGSDAQGNQTEPQTHPKKEKEKKHKKKFTEDKKWMAIKQAMKQKKKIK